MRELLLVGTGGFLGSVARYYLGGLVTQATAVSRFPYGTLAVNLTGCLLTGLLGGFTTFSAFGYETMFLAREHAWSWAVLNVGAQVILGLAAVWAGHAVAQVATR